MRDLAPYLFVAFVALLAGAALLHSCAQAEECQRRGGHVVTVYKSWLCVDADGRIVEDL